jgi:2-polyprenyl-6-hydroxyphenyl methylase/3-demethylubiquinone-9 3-methyltransferase
MIDASRYALTAAERQAVEQMLAEVGTDPSLEQIWQLMDAAWHRHGCDNRHFDESRYAAFYADPVWLLNGMFIEQHDVSLGHRMAITAAVAALDPRRLVDVGGGFGTLARLIATALPACRVEILDPFPPRHGVESCRTFANIQFVKELGHNRHDVLVSTDVLEHVVDPIDLLWQMVLSVRIGGHLLIANCFHPVIACHLPSTFHLRQSFDEFCEEMGLEVLRACRGSHATIYRRSRMVEPDWPRLRRRELWSQKRFDWGQSFQKLLGPWPGRFRRAATDPRRVALRLAETHRSRG